MTDLPISDQPWEVIRRAADKLQRIARWADGGPWTDVQNGWCIRSEPSEDKATWRTVAADVGRANSDWITTLSPAVAEPLVAWLRQTATYMHRESGACSSPQAALEFLGKKYAGALDFARRVLGEEQR